MVGGGLCRREALPSCRVSRQGMVCVGLEGWALKSTLPVLHTASLRQMPSLT